ncbi:MAG: hypothetical protein IJB03_04240 [Alistipes sp.]|nr:hypothetical protein [Alistipes sp.]
MKKLLSILALALCFVACQNDGVETVSNSDLVDVVLTVDAPELGTTRADEVVKTGNSAYGAIDFMTDADWADFDLRYILEVYAENEDGTGTPIYSERLVNCLDKYAPTTFALRLVPGRTYKFVVFADFVREGNAELTEPADKLAIADLYYNTADLRNISAITNATYEKGNWDAMNDNRDAYFVTENVLVNTNLSKTLTLTRPFAKLRVITTDLSYIEGYTKPAYVDIAYHDTDVYSSFNAVNGNLNDVMTVAPAYSFKVEKEAPYTEGYDKFDTNQTLFVDYLFAKNEQTPVNFTMTVWEAAADGSKGSKIHEHDFNTQIPIERNHLTTIIGDLLTVQENIVIEIDDDFAEKEIIRGWGDDNVDVTAWEAGKLNSNGDYEFIVKGDNDFLVTVNGAAVENDKLAVGTYVLAEDAEEGATLTFTVQNLKANETTRALVDVKVIGGTMVVEYKQNEYHITLDLVIEYEANEDARHAVYVYEGAIEFGATLATPEVEFAVDGLNITLTWAAVEGAESYTVTPEGEMPAIIEATEETTYTYTYEALEYNTEYSFTVVAVGQDITSVATTVKAKTGLATLATPVVKEPVVEGKVINLEWDAIEGAAAYSITVGTEMPAIVEEPKYTFNATDYNTEYTFNIVAIPADETKFNASEAAVVTVTSGAEEVVDPEQPATKAVTVAEFLAAAEDDTVYQLTGKITSITNTEYGNFYLTDDTGEVLVYGLDFGGNTIDWTGGENLNVGDEITIEGKRSSHNGTAQVSDGVYVSHDNYDEPIVAAKEVTVAEFLAAEESNSTMYQLTGVITRMYRENNSNDTLYGNFYLKDATGEVLIYGLMDGDGNKYWETSGAKIGDTITVQTIRASYSGSPQGKNATFIELIPFVEEASEWGVVGDLTGWVSGQDTDIVMYNTWKAENLFVAYNVEITSGAFKVRANNEWNDAKNYGLEIGGKIYADKYYSVITGAGSQNITPMEYGTYDVYFDLANERVALVTPGKEYANAEDGGEPVVIIEGLNEHTWGIAGSFQGWDPANGIAAVIDGDWAVAKNVTLNTGDEFKFVADGAWTLSYGSGCDVNVGETYTTYEGGQNMKFVGEAGAYNLYFSMLNAKFYMEKYSAAETITFDVASYEFANQEALASYEVGGITFAFDGGGNSNAPKYYTSGTAVRCYPKNTITISGKNIKKVEVVAPDGYTNAIDLYDGTTKLDNFVWEGSSEEVVLTFDPSKTSGQSRFVAINVTYE